MGDFYKDWQNPVVERLAKAICRAHGHDPDSLVKETGYPETKFIPAWWKQQNAALNTLAVIQELGLVVDRSGDV